MPTASNDGVEIYYETYGNREGRPLLLVCGLGMQMVLWSQEWFDQLTARGYYVIAFDNRDAGLSTHLVDRGVPDLMALFEDRDPNVTYVIPDMAGDAVAVLDAVGVDSAHVVGVSMGGMIAQQIAIDYPERVRSLCSIMSTTGNSLVGQATPEAVTALLMLEGSTREEAIAGGIKAFSIIGSPAFPPDLDRLRELAGAAFDRDHEPTGISRQMGAILTSPDRTPGLANVAAPTVVIHGTADPLVDVSGGKATADAIPGAKLVLVEGMGHDHPPALWDRFFAEIDENVARAEHARPAGATEADEEIAGATEADEEIAGATEADEEIAGATEADEEIAGATEAVG